MQVDSGPSYLLAWMLRSVRGGCMGNVLRVLWGFGVFWGGGGGHGGEIWEEFWGLSRV